MLQYWHMARQAQARPTPWAPITLDPTVTRQNWVRVFYFHIFYFISIDTEIMSETTFRFA